MRMTFYVDEHVRREDDFFLNMLAVKRMASSDEYVCGDRMRSLVGDDEF
jgi:hypothetical protein